MELNYDQIAHEMRAVVEHNLLAKQAEAISKPMADVQAAAQMVAEVMTGIDLDNAESCASAVPMLHELLQTAHAELNKVEQIKAGYVAALTDPRTHHEIISRYKKASGADWAERHVRPDGCAVIPELENREFSGQTIAEVVRACLPEIESALKQFSLAKVHAFFVAKGLRGKQSSFYQAINAERK
jgi:hypothetical protein